MQPLLFSMGGLPSAVEGREKLDFIEERLKAVEGFCDYPFTRIYAWYPMLSSLQNSRYLTLIDTRGPLAPRII